MGVSAALVAGSVWAGASGLPAVITPAVLGAGVMTRFGRGRLATAVAAGLVAGVLAAAVAGARDEAVLESAVPEGPLQVEAILLTDPRPAPSGDTLAAIRPVAIVSGGVRHRWKGPRMLAVAAAGLPGVAGEPVLIDGPSRSRPGTYRGDPTAGVISVDSATRLGPAPSPIMRAANALRSRLLGGLGSMRVQPGRALLAGFLVGDVTGVARADVEALRRSGLSHYVAVSGSNVALFLAAWWLVIGPLGWGPRRRAALGLAGIVVFALATRLEPSVVRASVMAGLVLGGRLAGVVVEPWTALGGAVAISLFASADLASDIGFQLSVAATAGILLGRPLWSGRRPSWVWAALGASLAAQAAVAPILLLRFGEIPLLAPVANLLAAPLVAGATMAGGAGAALDLDVAVRVGAALARTVLVIARGAADLPQLGLGGALFTGAVVLAAWFRPVRPLAMLVAAAGVAAAVVAPAVTPDRPQAVFLDVGQGDATLLRGPGGAVILIDGGPDPVRLADHLRSRKVRRVDLLVVSHLHADHVGGLRGITSLAAVRLAWLPPHQEGPELDSLEGELVRAGVTVVRPEPGTQLTIGEFGLTVLGPLRRYASPNDGSLAVRIESRGVALIMPGDIETFAQADLGPLQADVLKVPHQGAATSDPGWLQASAPAIAIISVGPNEFGHPSAEVVELLLRAGSTVRRTDEEGSISVTLDREGVPAPLPSHR